MGNRYGQFGFNGGYLYNPRRLRLAFHTLGATGPNAPGSAKAKWGRGRETFITSAASLRVGCRGSVAGLAVMWRHRDG